MTEIDLTSVSLQCLRDLVQERTGLAIRDEDGARRLVKIITPRIKKYRYQSLQEYYDLWLRGGEAAGEECLYLMAALTKTKSSFWRHTNLANALVNLIIPQWATLPDSKTIRIWCAACSTGEEPLSIAMALHEASWFEQAPTEIYASDANHAVIKKARAGLYGNERIRHLAPHWRDKYFTPKGENWQALHEVHQRIQWKVTNLMDEDEVATLARSQVIICRNVFIYFTVPAIYKTLQLFARWMPARAILISDAGDYFTSLVADTALFEPLNIGGISGWRRRDIEP